MSELLSEWVTERVSSWEWVIEFLSSWERVIERVSERVTEWVSESERVSKRATSKWTSMHWGPVSVCCDMRYENLYGKHWWMKQRALFSSNGLPSIDAKGHSYYSGSLFVVGSKGQRGTRALNKCIPISSQRLQGCLSGWRSHFAETDYLVCWGWSWGLDTVQSGQILLWMGRCKCTSAVSEKPIFRMRSRLSFLAVFRNQKQRPLDRPVFNGVIVVLLC